MATQEQASTTPRINLSIPEDLKVIYAEGVSNVSIGFPNSKIMFHTVLAPAESTADKVEQRRAVAQLLIPTHVLLDLSKNLINHGIASRPQIDKAILQLKEIFDKTLDTNTTPEQPEKTAGVKKRPRRL